MITKSQCIRQLLIAFIAISQIAFAAKPKAAHPMASMGGGGQVMTAPQCKCKDIDECSHDLMDKANRCKSSPECEPFIKKIGNAHKIRQCLDKEQHEMESLEKCVEKKVGAVGCTNDASPKNLTVPVMPMMDMAAMEKQMKEQPPQLGQAPLEMGQFMMCVDDCAMTALDKEAGHGHRFRRNPGNNCAVKLRCALAPPDMKTQRAFEQCEKELSLEPKKRFKASCECLKAAGVKIECPK